MRDWNKEITVSGDEYSHYVKKLEWLDEHDKQIRAEVIEEFCEGYKKFNPHGTYCKTQDDCIETNGWCIDCYKECWIKEQNNE